MKWLDIVRNVVLARPLLAAVVTAAGALAAVRGAQPLADALVDLAAALSGS